MTTITQSTNIVPYSRRKRDIACAWIFALLTVGILVSVVLFCVTEFRHAPGYRIATDTRYDFDVIVLPPAIPTSSWLLLFGLIGMGTVTSAIFARIWTKSTDGRTAIVFGTLCVLALTGVGIGVFMPVSNGPLVAGQAQQAWEQKYLAKSGLALPSNCLTTRAGKSCEDVAFTATLRNGKTGYFYEHLYDAVDTGSFEIVQITKSNYEDLAAKGFTDYNGYVAF